MKHLVLDIGGVFYRGWPEEAFWGRWAARTGLARQTMITALSASPEHREGQLGRISADEAFRKAGERLGIAGPLFRAMAEAAYLSDFNHAFAAAVRSLREAGVPVSALTNTISSEAELKARPELSGMFDHVVSSCDVGLVKPDPAIFQVLLGRLRAPAAEVVFVDDLIGHVESARSCGLTGVHFRSTDQTLAELAAIYPDTALSSRL